MTESEPEFIPLDQECNPALRTDIYPTVREKYLTHLKEKGLGESDQEIYQVCAHHTPSVRLEVLALSEGISSDHLKE